MNSRTAWATKQDQSKSNHLQPFSYNHSICVCGIYIPKCRPIIRRLNIVLKSNLPETLQFCLNQHKDIYQNKQNVIPNR